MASPQIENGHIDIANTIADKFCSYRLSGQEWQIVWVILRKTWGWLENPNIKNGIKKKMDRIALSQFEALTGIDRRKCHSILKKLITKKIVKKSVIQKGDRTSITYGFKKDFDQWEVSPKKVTITQKGTVLSPKKVTILSPKKAHTKETLKEKLKERKIPDEIQDFTDNFYSHILKIKPNIKPNIKKSQSTVDKLINIDKYKLDYIKDVLRWSLLDEFWSGQVFSLISLRTKSKNGLKKFDNISVAYDKKHGNSFLGETIKPETQIDIDDELREALS